MEYLLESACKCVYGEACDPNTFAPGNKQFNDLIKRDNKCDQYATNTQLHRLCMISGDSGRGAQKCCNSDTTSAACCWEELHPKNCPFDLGNNCLKRNK